MTTPIKHQQDLITSLKIVQSLKDSCNIVSGDKYMQCNVNKNIALIIETHEEHKIDYDFTSLSLGKVLSSLNMFKNSELVFDEDHVCINRDIETKDVNMVFNNKQVETIPSPVNYNRPIQLDNFLKSRTSVIEFKLDSSQIKKLERSIKLFAYDYLKISRKGNNVFDNVIITPHHSNETHLEINTAPIKLDVTDINFIEDLDIIINNPLGFIYGDTSYTVKIHFNKSHNLKNLFNNDFSLAQFQWDKSDELFTNKDFEMTYIAIL